MGVGLLLAGSREQMGSKLKIELGVLSSHRFSGGHSLSSEPLMSIFSREDEALPSWEHYGDLVIGIT